MNGAEVANGSGPEQPAHAETAKKRILVVDDAPTVRAMLRYTLEEAGYVVFEAPDGGQALHLLDEQAVDLLILDLRMPGLDGLAVARALRARKKNRELPIVMFTTEAQRIHAGQEAGINGWIVKPFQPQQMVEVVRRFLQ